MHVFISQCHANTYGYGEWMKHFYEALFWLKQYSLVMKLHSMEWSLPGNITAQRIVTSVCLCSKRLQNIATTFTQGVYAVFTFVTLGAIYKQGNGTIMHNCVWNVWNIQFRLDGPFASMGIWCLEVEFISIYMRSEYRFRIMFYLNIHCQQFAMSEGEIKAWGSIVFMYYWLLSEKSCFG